MSSARSSQIANSSMISALRVFYGLISVKRKRQLAVLMVLMLLGGLSELVTIGAIVPLLGLLADESGSFEIGGQSLLAWFSKFGFGDLDALRLMLVALFVSAVIVAGAVRLLLLYMLAEFNFGLAHDLTIEVFRKTLLQPYSVHVNLNSSEVVSALSRIDSLAGVVYAMLAGVSAVVIAGFIASALIIVSPFGAGGAILCFGVFYLTMGRVAKRRLAINSSRGGPTLSARVKAVQEALGGIRDVILDHSQEIHVAKLGAADKQYRESQASTYFLGPSPRFVIETIGMVAIASVAYLISQKSGGLLAALPVFAAIVLAAQRLLPLIQQIYQGWATLSGNSHVIQDVINQLHQEVKPSIEANSSVPHLSTSIDLCNVGFTYPGSTALALSNVTISLAKGKTIGVVGATGGGKSTLLDLILGLLEPTQGWIEVDGYKLQPSDLKAWQRQVCHVPQAIFLSDSSFAENIALGVPVDQIDIERIHLIVNELRLAGLIDCASDGIWARVGERGAFLSGGQRQRIGIARALYKNAPIMVLDEATSALDDETERLVMETVRRMSPDATVILVAHRKQPLAYCDAVLNVVHGRVEWLQHERLR